MQAETMSVLTGNENALLKVLIKSKSENQFYQSDETKFDPINYAQHCFKELIDSGVFKACPVTQICYYEAIVLELNGLLRVSVIWLHDMLSFTERIEFLTKLASTTASNMNKETFEMVNLKHRLKFEYQRNEAEKWFTDHCPQLIGCILTRQSHLQLYEIDRLCTIKQRLQEHPTWMEQALRFAAYMNPFNISEMAAYCEFAICSAEIEFVHVKNKIANYNRNNPSNPFKSDAVSLKCLEGKNVFSFFFLENNDCGRAALLCFSFFPMKMSCDPHLAIFQISQF